MARHVVARADAVPDGERLIVQVGGRSIGIFNVAGTYYAVRNRCPHEGAPLALGTLCGAVPAGRPGELSYDRSARILRCPWHGWEFDLTTGRSWLEPERVRVRRYAVERVAGASAPRAETYPIEVECDYLVVDLS